MVGRLTPKVVVVTHLSSFLSSVTLPCKQSETTHFNLHLHENTVTLHDTHIQCCLQQRMVEKQGLDFYWAKPMNSVIMCLSMARKPTKMPLADFVLFSFQIHNTTCMVFDTFVWQMRNSLCLFSGHTKKVVSWSFYDPGPAFQVV